MDPRERAKRFAALIRRDREKIESSEVSRQSTSLAETEKVKPQTVTEKVTVPQEKPEEVPKGKKRNIKGDSSKKKKKKLFPADPERQKLSTTATVETKLKILEQETRSKELAEGKIFIDWPSSMSWFTLWLGYVWGIPFSIAQTLMDSYEYMWYPRYTRGVGLGYGNPDAIDINVVGVEQSRHPVPQLGQHFVTESSQSQSLDIAGTERLINSLIDFMGAEKAFGDPENMSEGVSVRRMSSGRPAAEGAPLTLTTEGPADLGAEEDPILKISLTSAVLTEEILKVADSQITESTGPMRLTEQAEPAVFMTSPAVQEEQLGEAQESEGVGTSMGAPEVGDEGLGSVDITAIIESAEDPTIPGEPKVTVSLSQLEKYMEKFMMKRLSNNWSLDAYRNKMNDCVKRSHENRESIQKLDQRLNDFGEVLKTVQKDIAELREGDTAHEIVAGNLRKDIDLAVSCHNALSEQVGQLHAITEKHTAESLVVLGDLHKLSAESTTNWNKHDVVHMAADARISSLEELRRLDNVSRGQEKVSDYYSIKMEGFQECLKVQIANGTFNRRLLDNADFMSLVKDKSALMAKLAEKDKQIPWRAGSSHR